MKKVFISVVTVVVFVFLVVDVQAAGCNTAPQLGMTIGRCDEWSFPDGTIYACTQTHNYGVDCFFWGPPN